MEKKKRMTAVEMEIYAIDRYEELDKLILMVTMGLMNIMKDELSPSELDSVLRVWENQNRIHKMMM